MCVLVYHVDGSKSAAMGVFSQRKLATATTQRHFVFLASWVLNIYQHTSALSEYMSVLPQFFLI